MKKTTTAFVLTALLVLPALPAHAADISGPGFVQWLQNWLSTTMSWVTGEASVPAEDGAEAPTTGLEAPDTEIVPLNPVDGSSEGTEQGPGIDPAG